MKHLLLLAFKLVLAVCLAVSAATCLHQPFGVSAADPNQPGSAAPVIEPVEGDARSHLSLDGAAPNVLASITIVAGLFVVISLMPLLSEDGSDSRSP